MFKKMNHYSLRHFAIKSILNLIQTSPQTQEMDATKHTVKNRYINNISTPFQFPPPIPSSNYPFVPPLPLYVGAKQQATSNNMQ